ncbi:MAG TPA: DUF2279 domain-containing protein [Bacteroidia bacterium]|nr:DUF2279 domain-containing protein [Bacteroidia bacterium]
MKQANFSFKLLIIGCYCILLSSVSSGQGNISFFTPSPVQDNNRLVPLVAAQGALYAGSMIGLNFLWYKNYAHSPFHFFNDNKEWNQMDKLGHMLTAYTISRLTSALYRWTGVKESSSNAYGTALAMAYQTNIEIFDGFSSAWGFSGGDMLANTLGSGLFLSEQAAWGEQRVSMKISFHHTDYSQYRPDELGSNAVEESIKDYNGQTYWISIAIASFLPKRYKVPGWLCLDFGYGSEGMIGAITNPPVYNQNGDEMFFDRYRKVYCSLDIDLTKIPTKSGILKATFGLVSFIKIPMPTVEFSRGKFKFHILYF